MVSASFCCCLREFANSLFIFPKSFKLGLEFGLVDVDVVVVDDLDVVVVVVVGDVAVFGNKF